MQTWQLQEAEARLLEVIKRAELEGPQHIVVQDNPVAVVVSRAAFERLSGQQVSLLDFIQASPMSGLDDELIIERNRPL